MKISKRKIGILFIFVIIILIQGISLAAYQTTLKTENDDKNFAEMKKLVENDETYLNDDEQEVLKLINEYRNKNGLESLKPISSLQYSSKMKAEDLEEYGYFSHTSPNLGTPFQMLERNGVKYKIAGENLAGITTSERAVEEWINSKTHRENILEPKFKYTGISVIESETYGKIFVQLFIGIE